MCGRHSTIWPTMPGDLFCGDNLAVMRRHVATESVDLIYLDPPFNSDRTYNLLRQGGRTKRQAFVDTWTWDSQAEVAFRELTVRTAERRYVPESLSTIMLALRDFLSERRDTLAYLAMMAIRLVETRRVLRPTGSLYLHCDPTASHYLKLILDAIFGAECFRNEIIWRYRRWPSKARQFQRMHDVLLFYTAKPGKGHTFHTLYGYERLADSTLKTFGTKKQRADFSSGHRKPGVENTETSGPPLSDYWDVEDLAFNGVPASDTWEIGVIAPISKERTGFPTQKPEKLLERVVLASSDEGDVVLDPFCGCGTAIVVAEKHHRKWIGIDSAFRNVDLIKGRLDKKFTPRVWTEHLEPRGAVSARPAGARGELLTVRKSCA
jgi:site-specific DNA-methyltransferase (adenine-specific)